MTAPRIFVADLYGLGGLATSPGMRTLGDKIAALGKNFVVHEYDESQWPDAALDLMDAARPGDLIALLGYSLGANNIVQIAATLTRKVDYIAGIQPSYWGAGAAWSGAIALPANVRKALCIYNANWAATFGLGFARYGAPAKLLATTDLHPAVDNDLGLHGRIINDMKALAS